MAADTIERFKRMQGYDAVLITGTDEHGQKVERAAEAAGKTPQEFTDAIAAEFRTQWEMLGIRVDRFIRTTDPQHHKVVQWLFQRCLENGYIYKGSYTGQYCVSDELYVNDAKPGDPCPDLRPPHRNRHRRELLLQALGLHRQAAGTLRNASGFHSAGNAPQRSARLRAGRA